MITARFVPVCALLGTVCLPAAAAAADTRASSESADSPWRKHQITFSQLGFSSFYSCQGLMQKLEILLRTAGARHDVQVIPIGCGNPSRPTAFVGAELRFFTLSPTGALPAGAGWRKVALNPESPRELSIGDCELVERFRDQILPLYATRGVVDRVRCIPNHRKSYDLRFEVFSAPSAR